MVYQMERQIWLNRAIWCRRHTIKTWSSKTSPKILWTMGMIHQKDHIDVLLLNPESGRSMWMNYPQKWNYRIIKRVVKNKTGKMGANEKEQLVAGTIHIGSNTKYRSMKWYISQVWKRPQKHLSRHKYGENWLLHDVLSPKECRITHLNIYSFRFGASMDEGWFKNAQWRME